MNSNLNDQDLSFNARRLSRVLTNLYDKAIKPSGIRSTQFNILSKMSLGDTDSIALLDISKELSMDRTTLSRNIRNLCKRGYIATVVRHDRRMAGFCVTDSGREVLDRAAPLWADIQDRIISEIGNEVFKEYIEDFGILIDSIINGRFE